MPQPSTEYEFLLLKEAKDLQGRSLPEDIRWSYRTAGLAATPALPGPNYPDAAIILRFNYALDETRALEAFYIDPAVSGEAELEKEGTELTFSPATSFQLDVQVGFQNLLSAGGASLPPVAPQQFSIPGPVTSSRQLTLRSSSVRGRSRSIHTSNGQVKRGNVQINRRRGHPEHVALPNCILAESTDESPS
jgi:hypothetical protein